MSDALKHECGIALIRLLKPLEFYQNKYGTTMYGLNKLYLLMEKQANRGQDGAGIASIKLDPEPGNRYISRRRANSSQPVRKIFEKSFERIAQILEKKPHLKSNTEAFKREIPFAAELLLGHLRYATHGNNDIEACHPFLRQNNWMSRNLVLAGNFNFTNVDEQFQKLIELGQHPKEQADTVIALEKIGHFLDEENIRLFYKYKQETNDNIEANRLIQENLDLAGILQKAAKTWDGGYVMAGLLGHGDSFVLRDPAGIRPAFYYVDDEVVVVASERPAIQTVFNVKIDQVLELQPGKAIIVKKSGTYSEERILEAVEKKACSFERVYFSRGSDADIYNERKMLGKLLTQPILEAIDYDLKNVVFSYIPNTAETSFYGLIEGIRTEMNRYRVEKIMQNPNRVADKAWLSNLMELRPRIEKAAIKDAKLRTFISTDNSRDDMVAHAYDITYGILNPGKDTLVIIDDSIVRGTTLKQSILRILDRLEPKRIIVVSSAPQIRYPDCYGIDMSKLKDFVAFRAAIALLEERNEESLLDKIYASCKQAEQQGTLENENHVLKVYAPFSDKEISVKIAEIVKPKGVNAKIDVMFQTLDGLHIACPNHLGDWYFSGNFPTPGGNKVVNRAFINYYEKSEARAY